MRFHGRNRRSYSSLPAGQAARIGVIVQKLVDDGTVESLVARLGGMVTKDLAMIDAFSATVPAQAVTELAHSAGVRWVSLDAALAQSSCMTCSSRPTNLNAYVGTIQADRLRSEISKKAQPVTVAVIDSGIAHHADLQVADQNGNNRMATTRATTQLAASL